VSEGFLFARDGVRVTPTGFTRGPWDPGLLHGGAVGALFAEVGQQAMDPEFAPVRLTVDLMKPVPLREMGVDVRVVRTGRRLQLLESDLRFDGAVVARATLLALRPLPLVGDGYNAEPAEPSDGPDDARTHGGMGAEQESFVGGGQDFRFLPDQRLGAGVAWFRLKRDVFDDGVAPSPLARAAAASDVGGAVSARRGGGFPSISFINADISVHLGRPPEGEWIRLSSQSRWEPSGIGAVTSELSDALGPFGHANQALVLEARPSP
jgi:acyl-coenzyme A thioesterase PaaI-like protein